MLLRCAVFIQVITFTLLNQFVYRIFNDVADSIIIALAVSALDE